MAAKVMTTKMANLPREKTVMYLQSHEAPRDPSRARGPAWEGLLVVLGHLEVWVLLPIRLQVPLGGGCVGW